MGLYDKSETSEKKNPAWVSVLLFVTMFIFWSPIWAIFIGGWIVALGGVEAPSGGVIVMAIVTYIAVWIGNLVVRYILEEEFDSWFEPAGTLVDGGW